MCITNDLHRHFGPTSAILFHRDNHRTQHPFSCLAAEYFIFATPLPPLYASLHPVQEAAALVENPSLALTTENPLSALRMPEEGSTWQDSSQSLIWARGLSGTACSMLVKDLQTCALPCCPLQHNWPCCRCVIRTGLMKCAGRGACRMVTLHCNCLLEQARYWYMKEPKTAYEYGRHQQNTPLVTVRVIGEHLRQQRLRSFFPEPMDPLQCGMRWSAPRLPCEYNVILFTCTIACCDERCSCRPISSPSYCA